MTLVTLGYFAFCAGAIEGFFVKAREFAARLCFGTS